MRKRAGPLARVNLIRLTVFGAIAVTALLAFTLKVGIFQFFFRTALVVGIIVLFGSYLVEGWLKRRRNRASQ